MSARRRAISRVAGADPRLAAGAPGRSVRGARGQHADGARFAAAGDRGEARAVVVASTAPRPGIDRAVGPVERCPARARACWPTSSIGIRAGELPSSASRAPTARRRPAYLVAAMFEQAGMSCGLLGTVAYRVGAKSAKRRRTTPEASDLQCCCGRWSTPAAVRARWKSRRTRWRCKRVDRNRVSRQASSRT